VSRQQAPLAIYNGVLQKKRGRNVHNKKVGQMHSEKEEKEQELESPQAASQQL